jgi:propanediol dehydratase small subunit
MITLAIVITLVFVAAMYWFARNGVPLPKLLRSRSCQGAGWRHAFPNTSKEDIRLFLSVFIAAFSFHEKQRLKFSPSDSIFGIYRAMYPHEWKFDGCELEILEASIKKKYGIQLFEIWSESLTLGELFARVNGPSGSDREVNK